MRAFVACMLNLGYHPRGDPNCDLHRPNEALGD
jgi:hypothetical protein